jgi:hypothetical protein
MVHGDGIWAHSSPHLNAELAGGATSACYEPRDTQGVAVCFRNMSTRGIGVVAADRCCNGTVDGRLMNMNMNMHMTRCAHEAMVEQYHTLS